MKVAGGSLSISTWDKALLAGDCRSTIKYFFFFGNTTSNFMNGFKNRRMTDRGVGVGKSVKVTSLGNIAWYSVPFRVRL